MASENVLSADNQQERLRFPQPWYITGFVDGEGSFHVAIYADPHMKVGLKFIPEFHVSQNASSRHVLEELQTHFQCGNIKVNHRGRKQDQTHVFVVRQRQALVERVVPFFQRYPLRTQKRIDFERFAQVVELMANGMHNTSAGAKRIIRLAFQMNQSAKRRTTKQQDLIKIVESSETIRENSSRLPT